MKFLKNKNDGFIHALCDHCNTEIKLHISICLKVENEYKIQRNIKCTNCGAFSNLIRDVIDIPKIKLKFDKDSNLQKINNGQEMITYIGLVKWQDNQANFHPAILTLKNFEAEVFFIRRNTISNFAIPKDEEIIMHSYISQYNDQIMHISNVVEKDGFKLIINGDEHDFKGIEIEEIVLNQYELIEGHFKILNEIIKRQIKIVGEERENFRKSNISKGINLMLNGGSLVTSVGQVKWYDNKYNQYKPGYLELNGFEAEITLSDGSNLMETITINETGVYTVHEKHQFYDSIDVYTNSDTHIHRFLVNLHEASRNGDQDILIIDHFKVLNEYFTTKGNEFYKTFLDVFEHSLTNVEIVELVNNYIDKTDMIFWKQSYIVVFERLLNQSKIGQITLLCNDDSLVHNLKYNKLLEGNDDVNLSILLDYHENTFLKLSKILEKRIHLITEEVSSFVAWRLLRQKFIDYYHKRFSEEYGSYFKHTPKTLNDYVNIYGSIGTIDIDTIENAGRFTFFLIGEKIIETDNYILANSMLIDVLLEYTEKKKLDDFERSLMNNYNNTSNSYSIDDVDLMSGHEFEQFVAQLFSKMGYSTQVTKGSGDQGVDVIAERNGRKFGIQAKCYANAITNKAVQEVTAGINHYKLDKAIVVTNNYFTDSAKELAQSNGVVLWDRNMLKEKINDYL